MARLVIPAGGQQITWRGLYSATTAYVIGDAVRYERSSWIAKVNTTAGTAPPADPDTASTSWDLWAREGDVGPIGPPGPGQHTTTTTWAEPISVFAHATNITLTDGRIYLVYFTPRAAINSLANMSIVARDAGVGQTLGRLGIYSVNTTSGDLTKVAQTAADATIFTTGLSAITRALEAAVSLASGSRYALALLSVGGTTAPKVHGSWLGPGGGALMTQASQDGPSSGAVNTQTDLPATILGTAVGANDFAPLLIARP